MSIVNTHYDGCEIKHISISNKFSCFVPQNDPKTLFMFEVRQMCLHNDLKLLAKIDPMRVCSEPCDIKKVTIRELGSIIYVMTYDNFNLRVRRSQLCSNEDTQLKCIFEIPQKSISDFDFNVLKMRVVAYSGSILYLYHLESRMQSVQLGTHKDKIISVKFLANDFIGSIDESNLLKIWKIENLKMHSSVSVNGFSYLTFSNEILYYGTSDGQLFSLSYTSTKSRPEFLAAIPKLSQTSPDHEFKNMQKEPSRSKWNITKSLTALSISDEAASEILAISTANNSSRIVVVTSAAICLLNQRTRSYELSIPISGLFGSNWNYATAAQIFTSENRIVFTIRSLSNRYVLASMEKSVFSDCGDEYYDTDVRENECETLSFLATTALDELSPFNKALALKSSSNTANAKEFSTLSARSSVRCLANKNNSGSNSSNRPVTFGHKIKSSGYAVQNPKVTMFKPRIQKAQKKVKTSKEQFNSKLHCRYPIDVEPSFSCLASEKLEAVETPIFAVSYSLTGDHVAVAQGNGLCSILRLGRKPDGSCRWKEESVLAGHGGIVSNADWSLDGRLILSTSSDRTGRIWSASGGILRLVISSTRGASANGHGEIISFNTNGKGLKVSSDFADHVQFGRFHLEDNFFHLTCRNQIYFFTYKIDINPNALQKCHAVASYKRVAKFEFDNCTRLTAVSSTNLFYSYLLLAAGSDHSLSVLDINTKTIVRSIPAIHDATVTGIAINQGSFYSSFTGGSSFGDYGGSYSLFATAAPGNSVRIWDLRVARSHVAELARCRIVSGCGVNGGSVRDTAIPPVTLTFSPCGKYVCFGALSSYTTTSSQYLVPAVVDIRKVCSPLALLNPPNKRACPSNAANIVAWNPIRPEITTGSLDGRLFVYG